MGFPDSELHDRLQQRHGGMHGGFSLLANVKRIAIEEPFEVTPGVFIRHARGDEALSLRELVTVVATYPPFGRDRNPYETRVVLTPTDSRVHTVDLPAGEHRYCIAEYTGPTADLATARGVSDASVLTIREILIGVGFQNDPPEKGDTCLISRSATSWDPFQRPILHEARISDEPLFTLELSHLEDLKRVVAKLQRHDDEGIGLLPALSQFRELHMIPYSPLRFLGYVAILESLLTHAPNPKDPSDSLTKQVRQKMLLLGRRSYLKIPYERFGADCKPERLWTKLYAYRSAVAHGVPADFAGDFQMLRSAKQALDFIRESTAAVMRQTLEEPGLVYDLRAC